MSFGKLGAMGRGFGHLGVLGRAGITLPTVMRQVANRVSFPQSINASFVAGRAGTQHWLSTPVNGVIEVRWPNYRVNSGETGPTNGGCWEYGTGATLTGTAQITYTSRTTGLSVTVNMTDAVGGTTALSAASGAEIVALATIDMMPGTKIKPEFRGSFANGVILSQFKSDLVGGDFFEFAATVGALGSGPVQTFADTWYGPCMIRALSNKPVILLCEDSRGDGIYDVPNTTHGDGGQGPRLWGEQNAAYFNMSGRGETAAEFAANTGNARRLALAALAGATAVELGLGINDFSQTRTAAQVAALNQTIATAFGVDAIWKTIDPFTSGSTTAPWNTNGNNERVSYNTTVRGKPRYWDTAGVLEVSGGWVAAEAVVTNDAPSYIHESNSGNKCAAATAAVVGTSLALHGIAPRSAAVPAAISNLVATAQSTTTVLLTYTVIGAGHEYRLNGGSAVAMPTNRIITGLTAATAYTVEVRGYNAIGAGAWSNVANVTTQAAPLSAFDAATVSASVTLSESNIRATNASAGDHNARSTTSKSSGLLYFEIQRVSGQIGIGLCTSALSADTWVGNTANSCGMDPASDTVFMGGSSQGSSGVGSPADGDIIGVALNMTTRKVWFSRNGSYGSGQVPASGTGGFNLPASGALLIVAAPKTLGANCRIRTASSQMSGSPPSGFSTWDGV